MNAIIAPWRKLWRRSKRDFLIDLMLDLIAFFYVYIIIASPMSNELKIGFAGFAFAIVMMVLGDLRHASDAEKMDEILDKVKSLQKENEEMSSLAKSLTCIIKCVDHIINEKRSVPRKYLNK